MFSIKCLVDDRLLAPVLTALAGKVRNLEVVPVVNAEIRKGKVQARTPGDPVDLLVDWMRNNKMQEITGPQAKQAFGEMGLPVTSYSHYLALAVKHKKLRKLSDVKRDGPAGGMMVSRFGLVLLREDKS